MGEIYVSTDVETDGPIPGPYSMLSLGSAAFRAEAERAAFGRRAFLTDLLIGAVIAVLIYLLFGKLLTLSLPAGPLENLF